MSKESAQITLAITDAIATTPAIIFSDQLVGEVIIPAAASGLTSLTWYTCDTIDGTYVVCYDVGTAGAVTVAHSRAYRFPVEVAGCPFLKIVGNAAKTVIVNLKS